MSNPEFDFPERRNQLDKLMSINALAKSIAMRGTVTEVRQYTDDFFDFTVTVGRMGGDDYLPQLDPEPIEGKVITHKFEMPMTWGTVEISITEDNEVKIEEYRRSQDTGWDYDISKSVEDEIGMNLMPRAQAKLYAQMLSLMASRDPGTDSEAELFPQFSQALLDIAAWEADVSDDADPIDAETIEQLKAALEKIASGSPLITTAYYQLALGESEGRYLGVISTDCPTPEYGDEVLNLSYDYKDEENNSIQVKLTLKADGESSYSRHSFPPHSWPDDHFASVSEQELSRLRATMELRKEALAEDRRLRAAGLDKPTNQELDEMMAVLEEAAEI